MPGPRGSLSPNHIKPVAVGILNGMIRIGFTEIMRTEASICIVLRRCHVIHMTDFVNNTSVVVVLSEIGIEIMRREINRVVRLIRKRCGIFLWHNVRMLCCG